MRAGSVIDLVGNTPLVELRHLSPKDGVRFFAKLEGTNPSGSVKDRIVRHILLQAAAEGRVRPGDTVIEASTGNTGLSLALLGRRLGYRVVVVVPESASPEVLALLLNFGAEAILHPAQEGMKGASARARSLARDKGYFFLDQFANPLNCEAHYQTTGAEILADLSQVDVFVAGLGTGGTLMGVGHRLRQAKPQTQIVAVEPYPGSFVQGIRSLADGFVPPILDLDFLDGKLLVRGAAALRASQQLVVKEGIFAGTSSGAVLHGALRWSRRLERGNVVLLFADAGGKYLRTPAFSGDHPPQEEELDDIMWW